MMLRWRKLGKTPTRSLLRDRKIYRTGLSEFYRSNKIAFNGMLSENQKQFSKTLRSTEAVQSLARRASKNNWRKQFLLYGVA